MKKCGKCGKEHDEPTNIIGTGHGYIWFNCDCLSTLVLKYEPINPADLTDAEELQWWL